MDDGWNLFKMLWQYIMELWKHWIWILSIRTLHEIYTCCLFFDFEGERHECHICDGIFDKFVWLIVFSFGVSVNMSTCNENAWLDGVCFYVCGFDKNRLKTGIKCIKLIWMIVITSHADNVIGNATICLGGRCEYGLKRYLQQCEWYLTNDYPINVKNSLFLNANGTGIVTWYYKCYYNIFLFC